MSEAAPAYGAIMAARLTRQGQITVPKAVRESLGAVPGDDLLFEQRGGEIVVRRRARRSVLAYAGVASDSAPPDGPVGAGLTTAVEQAVGSAYLEKLERMLRDQGARPCMDSGREPTAG